MKNIIIFSIIALFTINAKATTTDTCSADTNSVKGKPTPYFNSDSAAIVRAGTHFKKGMEQLAYSAGLGVVGGAMILIAPTTIKVTYQTVRTSSTTVRTDKIVDNSTAVLLYSVGGACAVGSLVYNICGLNNIYRGAKALKLRANPTGISVQYSF